MSIDLSLGYSLLDTADWWNAVCPDEWDEVRVERDGLFQARLPFIIKKKAGFKRIGQPFLTPWAGPYFNNIGGKGASQLAREVSLGQELSRMLPAADIIEISSPVNAGSLYGFAADGFEIGATYTYQLDLTKTEATLWEAMLPRTRQNIRKAERLVQVTSDDNADDLIRMVYATFDRQSISIDKKGGGAIERVFAKFGPLGMAHIYTARDESGAVHASILCVCDGRHVIYSCGGADPKLRSSNAQSLLLWHAISELRDRAPIFDFAGSMSPSIAHFFLSFGGSQVQKLHIRKMNKKLELTQIAMNIIHQIKPK
jgi:hypothetical protein